MAAFTSSIRSSLLSSPKLSNAPRLSGSVPGHRMVLTVRRRSLDSRVSASAALVMEETPRKPESRVSMIVEIDLENRSYSIYISSGLLNEPDLLQRHVHGKRILVVTNTTIAPLYLDKVVKALTH